MYIFLITDIAINSHSTALLLLRQPTPMGDAIKVAPFLYSCILWSWPARTMNKTSVNVQDILPVNHK